MHRLANAARDFHFWCFGRYLQQLWNWLLKISHTYVYVSAIKVVRSFISCEELNDSVLFPALPPANILILFSCSHPKLKSNEKIKQKKISLLKSHCPGLCWKSAWFLLLSLYKDVRLLLNLKKENIWMNDASRTQGKKY